MNLLRRLRPLLALMLLALVGACSRPGGSAPPEAAPAVRAQALIDSGNAAFRRGDHANAARRYASATLADPADPAAFYGLGMALAKLGRDDDARRAYARARDLARARGADPDSFVH